MMVLANSIHTIDKQREPLLLPKDVFDSIIEFCAQAIARSKEPGLLRFRQVSSPEDWADVRNFRLQQYAIARPYMLGELDSTGGDDLDARSFVYAAWLDAQPVATIRLTPYPAETQRYVARAHLDRFLGEDWPNRYLEWSRLLIARTGIEQLLTGLLVFACLNVFSQTDYTGYFGYASTRVTPVFRRFSMTADSFLFTIPNRGEHQYNMLKGDFATDWMRVSQSFPQKYIWNLKAQPSQQDVSR